MKKYLVLFVCLMVIFGCGKSNENIKESEQDKAVESEKSVEDSDQSEKKDDVVVEADVNVDVDGGLTSNWKIVSGDPKDNCSYPVYKGEAIVKVWYVYEQSYAEKEWLIKVAKDDLKKISKDPADFNDTFKLVDMDEELEKKLKDSSKDNPVTITIKGLSFYCEGVGRASLGSGEEVNFKQAERELDERMKEKK